MLWIHIGSPKTGTTALQTFLHLNEESLRKSGVNYMRSGRTHISHNPLPIAVNKNDANMMLEDILSEYLATPDDTHIISSEILFRIIVARKLQADIPEALRRNVKVVCYLRRQDSYAEVMYKQLLKNGRIPADRGAFLNNIRPRLNYTGILDAYSEIFGRKNIIVRPFVRSQLVNRDIIDDFLYLIGVEKTDRFESPPENTNKTLSVELSEMLSNVGAHTDFGTREVIRELIKLDLPDSMRSGDVFSLDQRKALMEDLETENAQLVEKYLPESTEFFEPRKTVIIDPSLTHQSDKNLEKGKVAALNAMLRAINNIHNRDVKSASLIVTDPGPAEKKVTLLPSWYQEIYPGGSNKGFYHNLGDYAASFVDRGNERLLVTFDNLHNAGNLEFNREPWAQKFCSDHGWSHLGIYAQMPTWFRDKLLIDFLNNLRDQGFFEKFDSVALAGTSMGGFAALTFASLSPGSTVVAFSPQTTLDNDLVPWETRFAKGRAANWALEYSDAADQVGAASKVYIVYDPFMENDKKHIERLSGDNLVFLKGFGLGHKSALLLNRMGQLKTVMEKCVHQEMNPTEFYELIRNRKDIYMYRLNMEKYLTEKGKDSLIPQFRMAFRQRRKAAAKS